MKIGIVKHLNARPLTYGFEKSGSHELVFENPSVLKDLLLKGKLDTALISSVECIRNESVLAYSTACGVVFVREQRYCETPHRYRFFLEGKNLSYF